MRRTSVVLIALVAALVIGATAVLFTRTGASAQGAWPEPPTADPGLVAAAAPADQPAQPPDLRRRLNLTDEQAKRVEQIMATFRGRAERLRIDLARARLDAREAFLQTTPDRARLATIARRIGDLDAQLTQARFDMLADLRQVLTPEQWGRMQMMRRGPGSFGGGFRRR
jgi:Spy/CpxP family protein refolding chaperone